MGAGGALSDSFQFVEIKGTHTHACTFSLSTLLDSCWPPINCEQIPRVLIYLSLALARLRVLLNRPVQTNVCNYSRKSADVYDLFAHLRALDKTIGQAELLATGIRMCNNSEKRAPITTGELCMLAIYIDNDLGLQTLTRSRSPSIYFYISNNVSLNELLKVAQHSENTLGN